MADRSYSLLESLQLPSDINKLDYDKLEILAQETRDLMLQAVSSNGGHLAPSLGVVELTIALLRICDPLEDRIIWDVGHQSYPYKILTDRFKTFHTLRTFGGISGFNNIFESPYDAFGAGHASTSISSGYGMVCADEILGRKRRIVSVIGDGSLSGGMAFEALNHLGSSEKPMVVVLNDNEMSISKNVGALSASLSRILTGELASTFRRDLKSFIMNAPIGDKLKRLAKRFDESAVSFFTPGILFEELGLRYIGPINGHKIKDIEKALNTAFAYNCPALIHVTTTKGKGYKPAEEHPDNFHSTASFNIETGKSNKHSYDVSWTEAFGKSLVRLAEQDKRVVAITAAMTDGTGLKSFSEKFPERFFDVGIAEEHAMTFAAGLAIAGAKPYFAVYSTFLQRSFDQIIHDVALQDLSVRICIDRAGLVGQDGATHHGAFDLSYLRIIPNMSIFMPRDIIELDDMLKLSLDWEGPVAIRYARGASRINDDIPRMPIIVDEPEIIFDGGECAIVSAGHIFDEAYQFYTELKKLGYSASLINLRFATALQSGSLLATLRKSRVIYTFEENVKTGGIGEAIKLLLQGDSLETPVHIMSLPDKFIPHGSVAELRKLVGLNAATALKIFQSEMQQS